MITTTAIALFHVQRLWFAFKLCSLYIWLQLSKNISEDGESCDLLSNFALCTFDYNRHYLYCCFLLLWFAFKLCSLYIWLQHYLRFFNKDYSCDLLSNFALCTFDYNCLVQLIAWSWVVICFQTLLFVHLITTRTMKMKMQIVVICFQTLLFVHLITTHNRYGTPALVLWFAFKLCSLYIWLQRLYLPAAHCCCCDLLSNFALCTFDYNREVVVCFQPLVVICFQTLLFVHLITTCKMERIPVHMLWFAFKLCSLYMWLQHYRV